MTSYPRVVETPKFASNGFDLVARFCLCYGAFFPILAAAIATGLAPNCPCSESVVSYAKSDAVLTAVMVAHSVFYPHTRHLTAPILVLHSFELRKHFEAADRFYVAIVVLLRLTLLIPAAAISWLPKDFPDYSPALTKRNKTTADLAVIATVASTLAAVGSAVDSANVFATTVAVERVFFVAVALIAELCGPRDVRNFRWVAAWILFFHAENVFRTYPHVSRELVAYFSGESFDYASVISSSMIPAVLVPTLGLLWFA